MKESPVRVRASALKKAPLRRGFFHWPTRLRTGALGLVGKGLGKTPANAAGLEAIRLARRHVRHQGWLRENGVPQWAPFFFPPEPVVDSALVMDNDQHTHGEHEAHRELDAEGARRVRL